MPEVLVLNGAEVTRLLPMGECIDVMERALAALVRGEAAMPLRGMAPLPDDRGLLATMPSTLEGAGAGVKVITVVPGNEGTPYDAHQGVVLLFELEHGFLIAIADATAVTAIRTAAVSGVATRHLAREDASVLAILGTGTQARSHLEAMLAVRPIERASVWSRTSERARRFAERGSAEHGIPVEPAPTAERAVEGADLVCTVTSSSEPILRGAWVEPGTHVNAVGYAGKDGRELDTELVARARLFVDRRESALAESGDVGVPIREGAIGEDHIAGELGEVVTGTVQGRTSRDEVTVFESLGLAIEDLAAAHHLYMRASRGGGGVRVSLGGLREEGP